MAYSEQHKLAARRLYVFKRLSQEGVAAELKIAQRTIRLWREAAKKNGDDWDVARRAHLVSAMGAEATHTEVLEDFMILFQETLKDLKGSKDLKPLDKVEAISRLTDAYNKAMAAYGRQQPQISKLAIAMEVLRDLAEYIRDNKPDAAQALLSVLEPFGVYLSQKYGSSK